MCVPLAVVTPLSVFFIKLRDELPKLIATPEVRVLVSFFVDTLNEKLNQ